MSRFLSVFSFAASMWCSSMAKTWFEDEQQVLFNALDEFGEEFVLVGYQPPKPNFTSTGPDPERPATRIRAVFEREADTVKLGSESAPISSRDPRLTVALSEMPYEIAGHDRLTHVATGEVFEITDTRKDGLSGMCLEVVQIGRPR